MMPAMKSCKITNKGSYLTIGLLVLALSLAAAPVPPRIAIKSGAVVDGIGQRAGLPIVKSPTPFVSGDAS